MSKASFCQRAEPDAKKLTVTADGGTGSDSGNSFSSWKNVDIRLACMHAERSMNTRDMESNAYTV